MLIHWSTLLLRVRVVLVKVIAKNCAVASLVKDDAKICVSCAGQVDVISRAQSALVKLDADRCAVISFVEACAELCA